MMVQVAIVVLLIFARGFNIVTVNHNTWATPGNGGGSERMVVCVVGERSVSFPI